MTADELKSSMEEFKMPLCAVCQDIGRAAGHGKSQGVKDPRKDLLRSYRNLLDNATSPKDVNNWVDSSALDKGITPELSVVLMKMKEVRIIELTMGIL